MWAYQDLRIRKPVIHPRAMPSAGEVLHHAHLDYLHDLRNLKLLAPEDSLADGEKAPSPSQHPYKSHTILATERPMA